MARGQNLAVPLRQIDPRVGEAVYKFKLTTEWTSLFSSLLDRYKLFKQNNQNSTQKMASSMIKSLFFFAACLSVCLSAPAPKPGVVSYEGPLAPYIVPSVNPFAAPLVAAPAAAPVVAAPAYTPYAAPYAASYVYPGYPYVY
ncbi:hypothetical protein M8J76_008393 [Diaphorina citri]|nr:hypothetical protein M8J76_008393 [Diaphorina citri]